MRIRILGQYVPGSLLALAGVELLIELGAFFAAVSLRLSTNFAAVERELGPLWPRALVFGSAMLISLLAFGLYSSRQRAPAFGIIVRLVAAALAGMALTTVFYYVIPNLQIGRGVMIMAVGFSIVGLSVSRAVFSRFVDDNIFKRRVLIYGCGQRAASIAALRRRSDRRGFSVVGFAQPSGEECTVPGNQLLQPGRILDLCNGHDVDEVVVAMDDRRRAFPILELLECRLSGFEVTELLTFLERETGRVRIDQLNPSWMIFGEGFRRGSLRLFSSRALDICCALILLVMTLPIMALAVLAIKIEDGPLAPVLYRQARVGLGGRPFDVLKFRSMRTDAERDGQAQWAQKRDPRVTRVGSVIRKLRVDELPQILNVLQGQMSFVGPRPERPQFVAELSEKIPYYVQRHCVKPGITGWAQLCYPYGSSEQDALEKLQYDLYYIKNNSLLFDLAILVQTAEVVFMGKGAR